MSKAWFRCSGRFTTISTPRQPTPTACLRICRTKKSSAGWSPAEWRGFSVADRRLASPQAFNIHHSSFIIQRFLPALGIADKPAAGKAKKAEKLPWPKTLAEQAQK
jgi:hypothetical protein